MKDRVAPVNGAPQRVAVADVAGDELHVGRESVNRRGYAIERPHVRAVTSQRGDDVAADEPGRPGDQGPHRAIARRGARRARTVPRAICKPKRVIARGTRSAAATTSSSAPAK